MNGFNVPELIIESLIRDGIQNVRNDPKIIDDLFAQLTRNYNSRKYGSAEITKIKALVQKEIAVTFSYHEVDAKAPCISIMIGSDNEVAKRDHLGDHYSEQTEDITDSAELEALKRVENLVVISYNELTGQVSVDDATDLSEVYRNMIYVDSANNEFPITGGVNNLPGQKSFYIQKLAEVDISTNDGHIKSSVNYRQFEVKGVTSDVTLVLGVHSKDSLTTKWLYILLKYFIISRKKDMIKRGLYLAMFSGSDFGRDSEYLGDQVKTRFLTITGKVDDTWRSDQVTVIDNIEIDAEPVE